MASTAMLRRTHPLSALDAHPLVELRQLRAQYGVVSRRRVGFGCYALTFSDGSEETWEFDRESGTFELIEMVCKAERRAPAKHEW
jgi:hypothetical protein